MGVGSPVGWVVWFGRFGLGVGVDGFGSAGGGGAGGGRGGGFGFGSGFGCLWRDGGGWGSGGL